MNDKFKRIGNTLFLAGCALLTLLHFVHGKPLLAIVMFIATALLFLFQGGVFSSVTSSASAPSKGVSGLSVQPDSITLMHASGRTETLPLSQLSTIKVVTNSGGPSSHGLRFILMGQWGTRRIAGDLDDYQRLSNLSDRLPVTTIRNLYRPPTAPQTLFLLSKTSHSEELKMNTHMQMMTEFLKTATPDEWLFVASTTNYDDKYLLAWMVEQPECPEAAALAIYWGLGAGYFTQYNAKTVPSALREDFDRLRKIETNFASGFYKKTDIGFNPSADTMLGENWTEAYQISDKGVQIPERMMQPLAGRMLTRDDIPEGWDDGMPPHVVKAVWGEEE